MWWIGWRMENGGWRIENRKNYYLQIGSNEQRSNFNKTQSI